MGEIKNLPSKGTYLFLVILGFVLGVIWGALSLGPYQQLKAAVDAEDADTAWENAKKIKRNILIGLAVNVLLIVVRSLGA